MENNIPTYILILILEQIDDLSTFHSFVLSCRKLGLFSIRPDIQAVFKHKFIRKVEISPYHFQHQLMDGTPHGQEEYYYPDGSIQFTMTWHYGKLIETSRSYYPNGNRRSISKHYKHDNYLHTSYWPNGNLNHQTLFMRGKSCGIQIYGEETTTRTHTLFNPL